MPSPHILFPAMTLNIGPQTICWPHRDHLNLAFGICLDWVLGRFDHRKGGHLVLHEARRILQLAPGRVVLFPSASITHENIPIADGETRYSVTGYAAGGFWRFIRQRFMPRDDWASQFPAEAKHHESIAEELRRWKAGCRMFKTIADLFARWS